MLDSFNRNITYMRISITTRCNLSCKYCRPDENISSNEAENILSFEEIRDVVREGVGLGITKYRLTGGEPTIRRGFVDLISMLSSVKGVEHLGMTTNGITLNKWALPCKKAGLDSVNVSLDTLEPVQYKELTRGGDVNQVITGIRAAVEAGLLVKVNMVILDHTTENDIAEMMRFCEESGASLQRIGQFKLDEERKEQEEYERPPKCSSCNRIRMLADGALKPCLFTNQEILLDRNNIKGSIESAIMAKTIKGEVAGAKIMTDIGG